mmetsp:Transcript_15997/g.41525  ORF Transcript_15997/g.41525 Transcript_15997/m.41525 type:complete len:1014 (+) Transcript_15997:689-3730(+)
MLLHAYGTVIPNACDGHACIRPACIATSRTYRMRALWSIDQEPSPRPPACCRKRLPLLPHTCDGASLQRRLDERKHERRQVGLFALARALHPRAAGHKLELHQHLRAHGMPRQVHGVLPRAGHLAVRHQEEVLRLQHLSGSLRVGDGDLQLARRLVGFRQAAPHADEELAVHSAALLQEGLEGHVVVQVQHAQLGGLDGDLEQGLCRPGRRLRGAEGQRVVHGYGSAWRDGPHRDVLRCWHQAKAVLVELDHHAADGPRGGVVELELVRGGASGADDARADPQPLAARGVQHLRQARGSRGGRCCGGRRPEHVVQPQHVATRGHGRDRDWPRGGGRGGVQVQQVAQQVVACRGGGWSSGGRGCGGATQVPEDVVEVGARAPLGGGAVADVAGAADPILRVVEAVSLQVVALGDRQPSAGDKAIRGLVVHRGQRADVLEQLLEESGIQVVRVVVDDRLVRKDHLLRGLRVCGQQAPVDVGAVPQVRVVGLLRGVAEHQLDHLLRPLRGLLQEQLHRGCEQLQLHAADLLGERLEEGLEQLICIVDALRVLADDPDHGCLGFGLIQGVQVLAQCADDRLVLVGVPAEDVLDHDDGLLDDVVDLGLDQLQQDIDAALRGALQGHSAAPDGANRLAHEVHVHLGGVLLKLEQDLVDVALVGQLDHDLQLLQLDVHGVVVLAEEHLDFMGKDLLAALHDQVDVPQRHVLDLRLCAQQRHQRRRHLLLQHLDGLLVLNELHLLHDDLHRGQHDRAVGVLQPRGDALHDALRVPRVARRVVDERVEDEDLAPLGALVQRGQQLHQRAGSHLEHVPPARLLDLRQRRHRVGHHHRVAVRQHLLQRVQEAAVLHHLRVDVVQLGDAHGRCLAHVGVVVLEAALQGVAQVLRDLVHADAAHGADGEGADERVGVLRILDKGVDGENAEVRLRLGVVDEVQVHQLLELQVLRLHAVHQVREQHAHVLAHRHERDHLLHRVLLLRLVHIPELLLELMDLTLFGGGEILRVSHRNGASLWRLLRRC